MEHTQIQEELVEQIEIDKSQIRKDVLAKEYSRLKDSFERIKASAKKLKIFLISLSILFLLLIINNFFGLSNQLFEKYNLFGAGATVTENKFYTVFLKTEKLPLAQFSNIESAKQFSNRLKKYANIDCRIKRSKYLFEPKSLKGKTYINIGHFDIDFLKDYRDNFIYIKYDFKNSKHHYKIIKGK
ncbi:MAG: hypothetical protein N4A49_04750 [Marinifilaceae bacterium]|jgi:hypothetical protein|nr:hypothetical protein [Marinifilaceae bacterium]